MSLNPNSIRDPHSGNTIPYTASHARDCASKKPRDRKAANTLTAT